MSDDATNPPIVHPDYDGHAPNGHFLPGHNNGGRPTEYGEAVYEEITRRLDAGESLRAICRDEHMPDESTARNRFATDDKLFPRYVRARQLGVASLLDEVTDRTRQALTDGIGREEVMALKVLADHSRWMAARLDPHNWAERSQTVLTGAGGGPVEVSVSIAGKPASDE